MSARWPTRKNSLRLKDWDYRTPGYYFITILTYKRIHYFDDLELKQIIEAKIEAIPMWEKTSHIEIDTYAVLPDHTHILFYLGEADIDLEHPNPNKAPRSVGAAMGTFKRSCTRAIRKTLNGNLATLWQRGYHDRIVRDKKELNNIRRYIELNPIRWEEDREDLDSLLAKMTYHP